MMVTAPLDASRNRALILSNWSCRLATSAGVVGHLTFSPKSTTMGTVGLGLSSLFQQKSSTFFMYL
jgi:hypothetical protein